MSPRSRDDVVRTAGRLFAERGYHGTSMRDLGRELGLLGSSLYSHIEGKQELLVEVVERGAAFFQDAAEAALTAAAEPRLRLRAVIAGHVAVVLDHRHEVRTFLSEAAALDAAARARVITARDRYEQSVRAVLADGVRSGVFRADLDVKLAAIFILSVLNSVDRWYRDDGRVDRKGLVDAVFDFVIRGVS